MFLILRKSDQGKFFIVVWSWLPESHCKGFLRFVGSIWGRKINRGQQSCRVLCDGLGKVVLIFDLCSICSLHLLNEQDFQWLKYDVCYHQTMAEVHWSRGDLLSVRLSHSCWKHNSACFRRTFSEYSYRQNILRTKCLTQYFAVRRDTQGKICFCFNVGLFFPALWCQKKDTSTSRSHSPPPGPSTLWWFAVPMFLFTTVTKIL